MGEEFDFRKRMPVSRRRGSQRRRRRSSWLGNGGKLAATGLLIGALLGIIGMRSEGKFMGELPTELPELAFVSRDANDTSSLGIGCLAPKVVDGDTLRCGSTRIRLSAIDAPEMPGHCRPGRQCTPGDPYASADHLRSLVAGSAVSCRQVDTDHYGRAVALCSVHGRDLSCEQVRSGHAIIRYGSLAC